MREKLIKILSVPIYPHELADPTEVVADYLLDNDVIPVVRCKDCKHLTVYNSPTLYAYCQKTHLRFEPFQEDARTHYCSYGERRTDDDC